MRLNKLSIIFFFILLLTVIVTNVIAQGPLPLTGNHSVCVNTVKSYGITDVPSSTFNWTVTPGVSGIDWVFTSTGHNTITINWLTPNTYKVQLIETNTQGCAGDPVTVNVTVNLLPLAPVVTTPLTYCLNQVALPLTATGTGLLWYTAATGGTGSAIAPTPSTTISGTTSYWVSQTNTSGCEGLRAQIDVTVNILPPAPIVTSPVTYCLNQTAVPLTAPGTGLLWYTTATGGTGSSTAPVPTTATAGTTSYWVSQSNGNNCESARVQLDVIVNNKPVTTPITHD